MSETVRKLCKKAKLASRDSTDPREDNLDLQEVAPKKICLGTNDDVSNGIPTNQLPAMEDEAVDEPVPEAAPSNYMSFLLSLSQDPQNEESIQAFSPEPLSSEQEEDTSSSESEYVPKEDKNYDVDIEKIKEILAVLHELYPDEMEAVIHTRNEWGKVLHEKYRSDVQLSAQDSQLQDIIAQWRRWSVKGKMERDTPFCYKCYLCNKAWWSFDEFRTHIKQHASCKLQMEHSHRDFNIVAYEGKVAKRAELQIDGKCFKCAKTYEYHVDSKKLSDKYYSCLYCFRMFNSCRTLSNHTSICDSNPAVEEARKQLTFTDPPCNICGIFLTSTDLSEHFSICHSVRSDEPIITLARPCHMCEKTFYIKEFHICLKKIMNHCCVYCDSKFQTRNLMNSHLKSWGNGVQCKMCNKLFAKQCMMGRHYAEHSDNFLMVHQCVLCDTVKLFETADELTEHRSIEHRSRDEKIYEHKIVMAKVMLQQCVDGEMPENNLQKIEEKSVPSEDSEDESDSSKVSQEQSSPEVEICSAGSSSENDDTTDDDTTDDDTTDDDNEESQTPNVIAQDYVASNHNTVPFENNTNAKKEETNDEDDPRKLNKVAEEHLDSGNKVVVKEEVIEVGKQEIKLGEDIEIENLGEDNDIDINTEKDNDNETLIINNELPEGETELKNSNDIESDDITDDNSHEKGTEGKTVPPKLIQELNEFLDLKPDIVGVKEENASDDEDLKLLEMEVDGISKALQSSSTFAEEVTENSEHAQVFQVSKGILESESDVNQAIKEHDDLIVLDSSDSDDEALSVIKSLKKEEILNVEPDEILKAGYRKRKIYRCSKCCFSAYHREYKEHVNSRCKITKRSKVTVNDLIFKCTKCNANFPNLKRYAVHFKRHGYDELACPQCKCQFENASALESHLNGHIKNQFVRIRVLTAGQEEATNRSYKCKNCDQIENRNDSFTHWESHLKLIHDLTEKDADLVPFTIGGRGQHALQPGILREVIDKLQEENLKLSSCFLCQRDFPYPRRDDSKRHLIEHLLEDAIFNIVDDGLKCQICSELHKKPDQYKKHMRDHACLPIYQCSICDKSFSDSSNFVKHKKVHNLEIFICDICNKKFQRIESLEKHIKMHAVTAPITCEHCDKVFQCPSLHRKHLRTQHNKLQPRCRLCAKTFATKALKAQHLWDVHKLRQNDADCPICGHAFRTLLEVKKHARDEHGVNLIKVCSLKRKEKEGEKRGEDMKGEENEEDMKGEENEEDIKGEENEEESDDDCLVVEDDTETLIVLD